jgi:ABC-2 type transport system ATP-binding protein
MLVYNKIHNHKKGGNFNLIEVKELTKKYGEHIAVQDLSFNIESGKIYGLLGPNGAGKSTTMNIITGCLAATQGSVTINGYDIVKNPIEAKKHIGYLPELPPLYTDMTVAEYLSFIAEAKNIEYEKAMRQIRDVMELTQIDTEKDRLIKNLSKGFRQRVGIAQALIGDPDIIILDEPTVGLDPKQIIEIRSIIRDLGQRKTVIISSHILAEISEICDHVMIISHGRLVANDTIENLEKSFNSSANISLTVKTDEKIASEIISSVENIDCFSFESCQYEDFVSVSIKPNCTQDIREKLFFAFAEQKIPIIEMKYNKHSLESIFLLLTEEVPKTDTDEGSNEESDDYTLQFSPEQSKENEEKEEINNGSNI